MTGWLAVISEDEGWEVVVGWEGVVGLRWSFNSALESCSLCSTDATFQLLEPYFFLSFPPNSIGVSGAWAGRHGLIHRVSSYRNGWEFLGFSFWSWMMLKTNQKRKRRMGWRNSHRSLFHLWTTITALLLLSHSEVSGFLWTLREWCCHFSYWMITMQPSNWMRSRSQEYFFAFFVNVCVRSIQYLSPIYRPSSIFHPTSLHYIIYIHPSIIHLSFTHLYPSLIHSSCIFHPSSIIVDLSIIHPKLHNRKWEVKLGWPVRKSL